MAANQWGWCKSGSDQAFCHRYHVWEALPARRTAARTASAPPATATLPSTPPTSSNQWIVLTCQRRRLRSGRCRPRQAHQRSRHRRAVPRARPALEKLGRSGDTAAPKIGSLTHQQPARPSGGHTSMAKLAHARHRQRDPLAQARDLAHRQVRREPARRLRIRPLAEHSGRSLPRRCGSSGSRTVTLASWPAAFRSRWPRSGRAWFPDNRGYSSPAE